MRARPSKSVVLAVTPLLAIASIASCAQPSDAGADDGQLYTVVIEAVLPDDFAEGPGEDERPVLHVMTIGVARPDLEAQVAVVEALAETADVRFVDEARSAMEEIDSGWEVRSAGLLVVVDDPGGRRRRSLAVDVYSSGSTGTGLDITAVMAGTTWVVSAAEDRPLRELVLDDG